MLPQKILKSWCSETLFLVIWEDKFCPKGSLNQLSFLCLFLLARLRVEVVNFILYKLCGFWNCSGYHFQLSILCVVSLYEYHKNSFENFRTTVEIWNFPIPNAYWSGFGIFEQNRKDPDEIRMIKESSQTYYFLWPHLCLTRFRWLDTVFQEEQFLVPRYTATSKIGNSVISLLWQLWCRCNPDHNKFSSLSNTTVVAIFPKLCLSRRSLCSNLGGIDPEKLYRATLSTWKVRRLNQLGTPVSIWNGSAVLFAWPGREFRLWSDFGKALIQTSNFSCT